MGQPGLGGAGGLGNGAGAEILDAVEVLAAGRVHDADQVDDMVGALDGAVDRPADADIGLDGHDLPDSAERLQMAGDVGPARRDADAVAALGERPHHAADEAWSAENGDQLGGPVMMAAALRVKCASPAL